MHYYHNVLVSVKKNNRLQAIKPYHWRVIGVVIYKAQTQQLCYIVAAIQWTLMTHLRLILGTKENQREMFAFLFKPYGRLREILQPII